MARQPNQYTGTWQLVMQLTGDIKLSLTSWAENGQLIPPKNWPIHVVHDDQIRFQVTFTDNDNDNEVVWEKIAVHFSRETGSPFEKSVIQASGASRTLSTAYQTVICDPQQKSESFDFTVQAKSSLDAYHSVDPQIIVDPGGGSVDNGREESASAFQDA